MVRPTASVVIATYRRPEHVRACLEHLALQTVSPSRIIVVDASPDSHTREVVADVRRSRISTQRARNRLDRDIAGDRCFGRHETTSSHSSTMMPTPSPTGWSGFCTRTRTRKSRQSEAVPAMVNPVRRTRASGRSGSCCPTDGSRDTSPPIPGSESRSTISSGPNMSVRMRAVRELGGIRDFYPGTCLREETDIALRMRRAGMKIVYTPDAIVRHVAGTYARGRRFDARYRYYGARNHVVLLATTLGYRDPHLRRYVLGTLSGAARNVGAGFRSVSDPKRHGVRSKARGVAGGVRRAVLDLVGTGAGIVASVRATASLRSQRIPMGDERARADIRVGEPEGE